MGKTDSAGARKAKSSTDSLFANYRYLYKEWFGMSRKNLLYVLMNLSGRIAGLYVGLYLPKIVVALVMEGVSPGRMAGTIMLAGMLWLLLTEINYTGDRMMNIPCHKYRHALQGKVLQKLCRTAYSNLEDPDYKRMVDRTKELYERWDRDVSRCIYDSLELLYLFITIPLTSGMLAGLHPLAVAALALGTWL